MTGRFRALLTLEMCVQPALVAAMLLGGKWAFAALHLPPLLFNGRRIRAEGFELFETDAVARLPGERRLALRKFFFYLLGTLGLTVGVVVVGIDELHPRKLAAGRGGGDGNM